MNSGDECFISSRLHFIILDMKYQIMCLYCKERLLHTENVPLIFHNPFHNFVLIIFPCLYNRWHFMCYCTTLMIFNPCSAESKNQKLTERKCSASADLWGFLVLRWEEFIRCWLWDQRGLRSRSKPLLITKRLDEK